MEACAMTHSLTESHTPADELPQAVPPESTETDTPARPRRKRWPFVVLGLIVATAFGYALGYSNGYASGDSAGHIAGSHVGYTIGYGKGLEDGQSQALPPAAQDQSIPTPLPPSQDVSYRTITVCNLTIIPDPSTMQAAGYTVILPDGTSVTIPVTAFGTSQYGPPTPLYGGTLLLGTNAQGMIDSAVNEPQVQGYCAPKGGFLPPTPGS